jgi:hypothetical protein
MEYRRALVILAAVLIAVAPSSVAADGAPYCQAGEVPAFHSGFAALREQLANGMGEPLDCEHSDHGLTLQWTTTGVAYYDSRISLLGFNLVSGPRRYKWALTSDGLVFWEGPGWNPPSDAVPVSSAICEFNIDATPAFDQLRGACAALFETQLGDPFVPTVNAATPQPTPTAVVLSPVTYPTRNGPRTIDQLRQELATVGYTGPWDDIASLLNAYDHAAAPTPRPTLTPQPTHTTAPDYSGACFQVSSNLGSAIIFPPSTVNSWCMSNAQRDGMRGVQCTQFAIQQAVDLINLVTTLKLTQKIDAPSLDVYYSGCMGR